MKEPITIGHITALTLLLIYAVCKIIEYFKNATPVKDGDMEL
jgi:hypothetical protein